MFKKTAIATAFAGSLVVAGMVSAETRVVFTGGHEPARQVRTVTVPTQAPYALTGSQSNIQRFEPIRIDSRIVGYRVVNK